MPETEVAVACIDLEANVEFFTSRLGFRIEAVFPADDPRVVVVAGAGLRLRLERAGTNCTEITLRLAGVPFWADEPDRELIAPNGMRVVAASSTPMVIPPEQPSFELSRHSDSAWGAGRAGMQYRDLLPSRQGGRFIVSQIRIPRGGPVPDYVHFHKVRYQAIYCRRGWVEVVYEDQGPPFVMHAGDCVVQPPEIRHRVLRCSDGLEVIEVACPASHETFADHELQLPTSTLDATREFSGQNFVFHEAAKAPWEPWLFDGFECRETEVGVATRGLAGVRVIRRRDDAHASEPSVPNYEFDVEFYFAFVLEGALNLHVMNRIETLEAGDCFAVPRQTRIGLAQCSSDLQLLEMTLPADFERDMDCETESAG